MFTSDPKRHRIEETQFAIDMHSDLSHLLPDRRTARILVDAFFTHVGLRFSKLSAYRRPTASSTCSTRRSSWQSSPRHMSSLCPSLPRPSPGSISSWLLACVSLYPDLARLTRTSSKIFAGGFPISPRFIISSLVVSRIPCEKWKRPTFGPSRVWCSWPFTCCCARVEVWPMLTPVSRAACPRLLMAGMAIRSAFALGMHRDETNDIFPEDERTERKRLWRTLFVLDRFMSVSLGRPLAISADMAYGETLHPSTAHFIGTNLSTDQLRYAALAASIESAHTMGAVLSKIYQEGKISTRVAQGFSDRCKQWPCKLTPQLHWRNARSDNVRVAIAILHCNLMFCHSIILLTRPFFLYVLSSEMQQSQLDLDNLEPNSRGKIGRFSDACILASFHTIALVQTAYAGQYLPRLNPLSSYCLFTCGLIVAANEFARPGRHDAADSSICNAMSILQYCGTLDPHAKEAARVLTNFRDVIRKRAQQAAPKSQSSTTKPSTAKATYQPSSLQPPPVPALASDVCAAPSLSSFEGMDTLFSDPAIFDLLGPSVDVLPNADTSLSSSQDTPFNLDDLRQWPFWTSQPSPSVPVQPRAPVGPSVIPAHWQGPVPKSSSSNTDARSTPYPFLQ